MPDFTLKKIGILKCLTLFFSQVAIKNNISVFYFSCQIPMHVLFTEEGEMDKKDFLSSWKEIPSQNEVQSTIMNVQHNAGIIAMLTVYIYIFLALPLPSYPFYH